MRRALLLDFNGTLSLDEPILYAVYAELFAEHGEELTQRRYLDEHAGLSEHAILDHLARGDAAALARLVDERVARYLARTGDGSTVPAAAREAVALAAAHVPVAIVSGAARREIEAVLAGAGLAPLVTTIVADEDVERGKPDPACYRLALARLGVAATEAVAFEDTEAGVASARDAGVRCLAVTGTLGPDRLARADALVPALDAAVVRRELGLDPGPLARPAAAQ
jgi:beta-phosphoglucomutase-like phosphatase (HAD superfamily)